MEVLCGSVSPRETSRTLERGVEENQTTGYDPPDQGETEAGHSETGAVVSGVMCKCSLVLIFNN